MIVSSARFVHKTRGFALICALAGCSKTIEVRPPSEPTSVATEMRAVADLVNAHRRSIGCAPLAWISPVAAVAQSHSDDMVHRNFFHHENPDRLNPFQRLEKAGIRFTKAAENIAAGHRTGEAVFRSWLASPGHRRNIEDCALREHGIGFAAGTDIKAYGVVNHAWTHLFVRLE